MSLVEVAMALCLLSLTAVFLIGAITVLTRRDVARVNNLARANAYATRYLETQRSIIRGSSLIDPLSDISEDIAGTGTAFHADVTLRLGTVATAEVVSKMPAVALGSFVAFTTKVEGGKTVLDTFLDGADRLLDQHTLVVRMRTETRCRLPRCG